MEQLGDIFKHLVWDSLVKAALGRLFAAVPLLGWGPIGAVVTFIAMKFADKLYEGIKLAIDLKVIAFKNAAHRKAFDSANVKLKIIARDHGIESEEFQKARNENKEALSRFVSFAR